LLILLQVYQVSRPFRLLRSFSYYHSCFYYRRRTDTADASAAVTLLLQQRYVGARLHAPRGHCCCSAQRAIGTFAQPQYVLVAEAVLACYIACASMLDTRIEFYLAHISHVYEMFAVWFPTCIAHNQCNFAFL
jgi:hypothetical protein